MPTYVSLVKGYTKGTKCFLEAAPLHTENNLTSNSVYGDSHSKVHLCPVHRTTDPIHHQLLGTVVDMYGQGTWLIKVPMMVF